MPLDRDVQHMKYLLERIPLYRFLAVFQIPHDGLAHASECRESRLGKAGLFPMALKELRESSHLLLKRYKYA